jgi:hypothetical protein
MPCTIVDIKNDIAHILDERHYLCTEEILAIRQFQDSHKLAQYYQRQMRIHQQRVKRIQSATRLIQKKTNLARMFARERGLDLIFSDVSAHRHDAFLKSSYYRETIPVVSSYLDACRGHTAGFGSPPSPTPIALTGLDVLVGE